MKKRRHSYYRIYEYCLRRLADAKEFRYRWLWQYLTDEVYSLAMTEDLPTKAGE